MKYIELTIRNADIFLELNKMTAYTGVKTESNASNALYDRIVTAGEDSDILERYRGMACSELVERLKEFVVSADSSDESLTLRLCVSGAYDDILTPSLRTDIFMFITANIAARWFRLTFPEKADEYKEEAERLLGDAVKKLFHRKRPTRGAAKRSHGNKSDI